MDTRPYSEFVKFVHAETKLSGPMLMQEASKIWEIVKQERAKPVPVGGKAPKGGKTKSPKGGKKVAKSPKGGKVAKPPTGGKSPNPVAKSPTGGETVEGGRMKGRMGARQARRSGRKKARDSRRKDRYM